MREKLTLQPGDSKRRVIRQGNTDAVARLNGYVLSKTRHYFRAGARAVWLVYPSLEVIHVYESFSRIQVLTKEDVLDGGDVIPGLRLPLATLFKGVPPVEDDDPAD
jgi:hypothetical protein